MTRLLGYVVLQKEIFVGINQSTAVIVTENKNLFLITCLVKQC